MNVGNADYCQEQFRPAIAAHLNRFAWMQGMPRLSGTI
jgi:hypothetical protein